MSDLYPHALGVSCDLAEGCDNTFGGDFWVRESDDRPTRLGIVLAHAASNGWQIIGSNPETALTFCPTHSTKGSNA